MVTVPERPQDDARTPVVVRGPAAGQPVLVIPGALLAALARAAESARPLTGADDDGPSFAVDLAVGATAAGLAAGVRAASFVGAVVRPVGRLVLDPPLVPQRWTAGTALRRLAVRGRAERLSGERAFDGMLDAAVPVIGQEVVGRLDLTDIVVSHVDLEAVVTTVLDGMDLTEVVLQRVDLAPIVTSALDQLDLTGVVLERVDLERIVTSALDSLDLTSVVLDRVNLERIVSAALVELDLTQVVLEQVDLGTVVQGALDQLDLNAIVRERVDLAGIAEEVIDEIDLPEIIRESTGGVATEAVRGVRMTSIDADERLNKIVDRVLLRRRGRKTDAPGDPMSLEGETTEPTP
jgi:hypothetical protein